MNILVPYSWLKDYVKTNLSPKDFANLVSAHGPSIERWHETEDGDVVFDVEITTNRIDAFSVFGLAREANAILRYNEKESKLVEPDLPEIINGSGVNHELYVDVDEELCPRFTALVIDGVSVEKSPKFIAERLEKVGVRSLNNVVDVTNYVMWELGQPMHVFDYDKIIGHKMILRKSRAREQLATLDGVMRDIPLGSIVIEDGSGTLIDLAGIMGGENSAVDENTRRVLLFVQTYNPHVIRKTSMQMAHRTEAASRFEKGLDPEQVMPALQRGTALLREHAGGVVASDVIDLYATPYQSKEVSVSLEKLRTAIGVSVSLDQTKTILELLDFPTVILNEREESRSRTDIGQDPSQAQDDKLIKVEVPSFRADDITIPEDVIEEIARMYGYHNIPSVLPTGKIPNRPENIKAKRIAQAKTALKYFGFTEVYSQSATAVSQYQKLGFTTSDLILIKNPLTEDFVALGPELLPRILPIAAENLPRFPDLKLFELSKIYQPTKSGLPDEPFALHLLSTNTDLLQHKGYFETLLAELKVTGITIEALTDCDWVEEGTGGKIMQGKEMIGALGILSPTRAAAFGIKERLSWLGVLFDPLIRSSSEAIHFKPIPKYPILAEDVSFVIDSTKPVGPVIEKIASLDKLIIGVELIDTYYGGRVGENKKSITLRINYQSPTRLLSERDIKPLRERIRSLTY